MRNGVSALGFVVTCLAVFIGGELQACSQGKAESDRDGEKGKYAIAIHGGAGLAANGTEEQIKSRRDAMRQALVIGNDILKTGGSALDAVEKVVIFLEDDPQFNAGVGAVYNSEGSHELDASIMDGNSLACGAVAGVSIVKNPIALARLVMTETPHVLLAADGAETFAKQMKVELVKPSHFDTSDSRRAFEKFAESNRNSYLGTVGCVALDCHGDLAAATSTGGLSNKKFGRIGDSPIVGAGTYADNQYAAVSCTGVGEEYIRRSIAYDVIAQMKYGGKPLTEAVNNNMHDRLKAGQGGMIAVDRDGKIAMDFNTQGMARAAANSEGRFEVIWGKEEK